MPKVLIVNDLEIINKFLKHSLEAEGFTVDTVLTGTEGISKAKENRYDIILLDYKLPDINGDQVCRAIKADKGIEKVPIHFISALEKDKMAQVIIETGAEGYLDVTESIDILAGEIRKRISAA